MIAASFPIPRFVAPLHPRELRGADALAALAREVYGERDPAELFARGRPIRLGKRGARTPLEIDLPNVSKEELEVASRGSELVVRVRDARRFVSLPASVAGRPVRGARLEAGVLEVEFEA